MTKDPLKTLEKLRPDTHTDELWPQHLQAAERDRIMATSTNPTAPDRHRRGVGTIVLVAAIATAGGIGVAAATGLMPKVFTDTFSGWQSQQYGGGVNPDTAERIASMPGPDGTVFSVFVAHGSDGWRCIAPIFESAADAQQPGPSNFVDLGDYCRPSAVPTEVPEAASPDVFGGGLNFTPVGNDFTYDAGAGEAVRAELRTASGEILPTMLANGRFYAWGPLSLAQPRPTLVGYASDGTVVGVR
ncbi:hypothetical protein [Rhodococcus sp. 1139]|uniref:hypothetical protein n=1 Tax=Rhodococcus sp. 1139 TaxID=1833762 RepID=UPI00087272B7|nr:hypothetical protein [Rhodococcus sp. 1139]OFE10827.1 hypothetical protein A5N83_00600 [Rhodococcus sp. 1139]